MKIISSFVMIAVTVLAIDSSFAATTAPITLAAKQDAVNQAVSKLNDYAAMQQSLNIQNSDLAYAMRKAFVMADLLVHPDGSLDFAMCPLVKSAFISAQPEEYEVNMAKVLSQPKSAWPAILTSGNAPHDLNGP